MEQLLAHIHSLEFIITDHLDTLDRLDGCHNPKEHYIRKDLYEKHQELTEAQKLFDYSLYANTHPSERLKPQSIPTRSS